MEAGHNGSRAVLESRFPFTFGTCIYMYTYFRFPVRVFILLFVIIWQLKLAAVMLLLETVNSHKMKLLVNIFQVLLTNMMNISGITDQHDERTCQWW